MKLENKTKKELIDIILRKDDVEKDLKKELEGKKIEVKNAEDMLELGDKHYKGLKVAFIAVTITLLITNIVTLIFV